MSFKINFFKKFFQECQIRFRFRSKLFAKVISRQQRVETCQLAKSLTPPPTHTHTRTHTTTTTFETYRIETPQTTKQNMQNSSACKEGFGFHRSRLTHSMLPKRLISQTHGWTDRKMDKAVTICCSCREHKNMLTLVGSASFTLNLLSQNKCWKVKQHFKGP